MSKYQTLLVGGRIPTLGLGTWNATDEQLLEKALDVALEAGYRHIDTAYLYKNETVIGRVLKRWFESGKIKREELFVTTKLPGEGLFPDKVDQFFNKSLSDLQLEYVDLYLIHGPIAMYEGMEPAPTDHLAVWKKLETLVDSGKAKSIGVSNFNLRQVERVWQNSRIKPSCNQVEISPFLQQPELVKYCHDKGIVVVGYSSLGSPGRATRPADPNRPTAVIFDVLGNETVNRIAKKHKRTTAQVVLRFFLQKNVVMIPKSVTPARIKENFDVYSFNLDENDLKDIEALDRGEDGRAIGRADSFPKYKDHPEYPFK